MKIFFSTIACCLLLIFVGGTSDHTIFAQEELTATPSATPAPAASQSVNLTVSPISLNLVTDPGVTSRSSIKIRNNSDRPEYLQLRLNTFSANSSGDAPIIREFDPEDESQNWVTFSETAFTIKPGEWKSIQLSFSPPKSAALGYYYAILVERQSEAESPEGSSLISGVPAILVLSEVKSPLAKRELQLVSFSASKNLYEYLPANFTLVIKNTGNIQTMPIGDIFIDSQRTNDLGIMQLNPAKGMILPGTERTYTVSWDDGFPRYKIDVDEFGNEKKKLVWEFSNADTLRIGKFTATTLFVYDDGERDIPTEATLSFWVVPWKLLLLAAVALVLLSLGIILPIMLLTKRLKEQRSKKNKY